MVDGSAFLPRVQLLPGSVVREDAELQVCLEQAKLASLLVVVDRLSHDAVENRFGPDVGEESQICLFGGCLLIT